MSFPNGIHHEVRSVLDVLDESDRTVQQGARILPAAAYQSPAFHAFELDAVFRKSWLCVGRINEIPEPGDYKAVTIIDEPLLILRGADGVIRAMSALCRHRGHALVENCVGSTRTLVCPYHRWTYGIDGELIGAPRMRDVVTLKDLREESRLPLIKIEIWYGFIFVNFDDTADALAPTLKKLEPYLENYDLDAMVTIPAKTGPHVPWNWKMLLENYIEPYHTEYVHPGIHDFAPSTGVEFDPRRGEDDNAIVRYVAFLAPDGGLTERGWATPASFPPIETLSPKQRGRVGFGMIPPTMNLIFTPDMLCYGLIYPTGPTSLSVAGGLFTMGGWCMPKSTVELADFDDRAARLMEGSRQLGEQDTAVNLSMQRAKASRYAPRGRLAPLEDTLSDFNRWLIQRYRAEAARRGYTLTPRAAATE